MPLVFTVETGSADPTATSLASVADADAYWANRPNDTRGAAWNALTGAGADLITKQDALIRASDYVRTNARYLWRGTKKTYAQRMPWPREGASEADGQDIPDTTVPWQVIEAVSLLAGRLVFGDAITLVDLDRGGAIKTETVGPISTTYFDGAPIGVILQEVDGILLPLLLSSGARVPTTVDMEHVPLPDVFRNDAFAPFTTKANFLSD